MKNSEFIRNYKENLAAVKNFARKLTRNADDGDELAQVAMVKAFKSMHTFKEGSNFKNWAFTIVKNTFITQYNRRKKRGVVNAPIEDFTYALQSEYTTHNDALSKIRVTELWKSIETLSPKSKKPFKLFIKGFKYGEIAESLNIPIGTVKSRINFARQKMKTILVKEQIVAA